MWLMWTHLNRVHPLKVNVMSPADRPIPQAANAHKELNADRDEPCLAGQVPVVPRGKAERMGGEQGSHNAYPLSFRADP